MGNDPEIFVADEPTGNLDSETAQKIFQLIQKLSNLGKTVIIVTHEKEPYLTYDRIITLKDGQIVTSNQIRKMEVC